MNNTALRAGAQSANNTHMVFANEEHEKFYFEKLEQARYQDCYHKALIYILGISEDTRNHFSQIYDIKSGYIKTECLHQGWQTSGSVRVVRLAFNLGWCVLPSLHHAPYIDFVFQHKLYISSCPEVTAFKLAVPFRVVLAETGIFLGG